MRRTSPTSASDLPQHLCYLQPFRRKFASRPPEELNEDSGPAVLMPLLSKRIRGLSDAQAAQVIEQDRSALEQWLSSLGEGGDPLHFAHGFFLMLSPGDIVKLITEEAEKENQPKLHLFMDLPADAKLRKVPGGGPEGKLVTLKGLWLAIEALPKEAVDNLFDATLGPACGSLAPSVPEVRFGPVTGRKLVTRGENCQGPIKCISYALTVPGGHVFGSISPIGKKVDHLHWDETPFEACFQSLLVEIEPKAS